MFRNIAAYQFAPLRELGPLRVRLLHFCKNLGLRGTILLSPEGINVFVAGTPDAADQLITELRAVPGLETLEVKVSPSDHQPFNRMLVRLKKEIIAFGVEGIEPGRHTSPKLSPKVLKQWLDEGRPVTLLDTRNDYEVKLGTFRNAVPAGVNHFREFPAAVRRLPESLKEQPVVMFCTGGIRCEKAGPFMEREGFRNLFQLDGGILKYFEECGSAHYDGECFVFDQRVGLAPNLRETGSDQCFACLVPLTEAEQNDPRFVPGVSCPHCFRTPEQRQEEVLAHRHDALRRAATPLPGSVPYDNFRPINVPKSDDGGTLLDALCRVVRPISAAAWAADCERGLVVDSEHQPAAAGRTVRAGERFYFKQANIVEPDVNADLRILHEDAALVVVNKPAPLPVHSGGRFHRNTLQHLLTAAYHPEKPRPAHRLDANTTGVLLLTRTRHYAARVQPQFAQGEVTKVYLVRVQGHPSADEFRCEAPISTEPGDVGTREVDEANGLPALTEFRVVVRHADRTTLLEARPHTGRTNQIRVHLWHLGLPVVGDPVYLAGGAIGTVQTLPVGAPPLCLHSWKITIRHPLSQERVTYEAPPPEWAGTFEN